MGLHRIIVVVAILLLAFATGITGISVVDSDPSALTQSQSRANILQPGRILHGMHPGGGDGQEDIIIDKPGVWYDYENSVGKRPAWIYFSHEWGYPNGDRSKPMNSHGFPSCIVQRFADREQLPFIRLMLRSDTSAVSEQKPEEKEAYFTLNNIIGERPDDPAISEQINRDLIAWGVAARAYGQPLIVECGTEVNGDTFSWNSQYNGPSGARLFRQAYRHIVHLISGVDPSASNINWVSTSYRRKGMNLQNGTVSLNIIPTAPMKTPKMLLTGWVFPFTAHRASERLTVSPSALSWNVH